MRTSYAGIAAAATIVFSSAPSLALARPAAVHPAQAAKNAAVQPPAVPPHESGGDAYLPPTVPPILARPGDPGVRAERGGNGVQVNTNALGQNIPNDAANEPSIAIDPTNPNRIVIGWRQFDNVNSNFRQAGRAYSSDAGASWTFPGVLTPGVFRSDPVMGAGPDGTFYYYSLKENFLCDMFISSDGGVTWSNPIPALGGDKEWFVVDNTGGPGEGNLYMSWSTAAGCCGLRIFTRSTDGGSSYDNARRLPSLPVWGTQAVGPDNELYISGISGSSVRVIRSTNPTAGFVRFQQNTQVPIGGSAGSFADPNPGGLAGQVWVATDTSSGPNRGNVYVLTTVDPSGSDPLDIHFCRSTDGGATWDSFVRINDDTPGPNSYQWFGTMSVAPNGRIDVVWNDTRASQQPNLCRTYYAFSTDGGVSWSANMPVTDPWNSWIGWPNQNKIGDYYHMISDNAGVNLAYSATFNGEQDVYFLRIEP